MAGIVDQIKERVDIVDLISGYLKLQKSGVNYKARCPFHNEKSGSFFVSPERQIWHCFGCGLGGDVFGFVKQIDGVEFPEALRMLAARAGIKLVHRSSEENREYAEFQNQKTKLLDICELSMRFFEKQLYGSVVGKQALAYLRERGLTGESIKSFHLGYAPESWSALCDFLGRKYSSKDIFDAGMVVKKDGGGYFDRFRSRIMFPIFDINGQVVGFTARIFRQEAGSGEREAAIAKYVNSPQTPIYDKSKMLYGLHAAKIDIRRTNRCLVVEGNMDVIMSHQAGVKHVVASSGTALTDSHLKTIKRYTENLDLCFDADNAGELARDRGVDLALAKGFNVGIIMVNEQGLKDPADYVLKYGEKWSDYTQKSKPFMDFYFETAQKTFDITTALGKKLFSQKVIPFLASIASKIEQSHWVSEVALALKTKEEILYHEMAGIKPRVVESEEVSRLLIANKKTPVLDPMEETLLSLIFKKPELAGKITTESYAFISDSTKELIEKFKLSERQIPVTKLASAKEPELAMSLEFINLKSQELWNDLKNYELEAEFDKLIGQIKKRKVSARLAELEYDIKLAEKAKEKERLAALVAEFSRISKQLAS